MEGILPIRQAGFQEKFTMFPGVKTEGGPQRFRLIVVKIHILQQKTAVRAYIPDHPFIEKRDILIPDENAPLPFLLNLFQKRFHTGGKRLAAAVYPMP